MDSNKNILELVDHVYDSLSIYHGLIVTRDDFPSNMFQSLVTTLKDKDYPVMTMEANDMSRIDVLESHFRIFVVNWSMFKDFIEAKHKDLTSLSVIVCTENDTYLKVNEYVRSINNINIADNLYIFSCSNV